MACTDQGEVFTWGDNDEGQLGDGSTNAIQVNLIPYLNNTGRYPKFYNHEFTFWLLFFILIRCFNKNISAQTFQPTISSTAGFSLSYLGNGMHTYSLKIPDFCFTIKCFAQFKSTKI